MQLVQRGYCGPSRQRRSVERRALPPLVQNLAIACLSVLFTLALAEAAVRMAGFEPLYDIYSKPSLFWKHDPTLGWSHQQDVEGTFVGPRPWPVEFTTPVLTNSMGLRGPEIGSVPEGGWRVLVLGDSVVAGFEVPYERTFTALLEDDLSERLGAPVQVINAGVRGYGTDQSYLYYRERGRDLDPDLVVLFHSGNDVRNNMTLHRMRRAFGKPAFVLQPDGELELVNSPTPEYEVCSQIRMDVDASMVRSDGLASRATCALQIALFDHSALFSALSLRLRENSDLLRGLYELGSASNNALALGQPIEEQADYPARLTAAIIRELAETAASQDAGFILLGREIDVDLIDPDGLRNAGVTPFAVAPSGPELRFDNDPHYNVDGHREAARRFAPLLAQRLRDIALAREKRRPAVPQPNQLLAASS